LSKTVGGANKFLSEWASAPLAQGLFYKNNHPVSFSKLFPLVLINPQIKIIQKKI